VSKRPEDAKTIRSQSVHSSRLRATKIFETKVGLDPPQSPGDGKIGLGPSLDVRAETIPRAGYATLCGSLCVVADTQSAGTAFKTICMHHE